MLIFKYGRRVRKGASDYQFGELEQLLLQGQLPHLAAPQLLTQLEDLLVQLLELQQLQPLALVAGVVQGADLEVDFPQLLLELLLVPLLLEDVGVFPLLLLLQLDLLLELHSPRGSERFGSFLLLSLQHALLHLQLLLSHQPRAPFGLNEHLIFPILLGTQQPFPG